MKQSTALLATLACAQATKLSSKSKFISFDWVNDIPDVLDDGLDYLDQGLDYTISGLDTALDYTVGGLEDFAEMTHLDDAFDYTVGGLDTALDYTVEGLGDFAEYTHLDDAWDYTVDGLETGYEWTADGLDDLGVTDFVEDDLGGFFGDIGDGLVDAWDWASNDGNWEAFGKTMLAGGSAFFKGDFDTAGDIWGNDDMYTEKFWNDLDAQKKEYERRMAEAE